MNCEECKRRMYPEDPSQPMAIPLREQRAFAWTNGRSYYPPICHSCSNFDPSKEEVKQEPQRKIDLRPIKAEVNYILNKINTHIDETTKPNRKTNIYKDYYIGD